MDYPLFSIIIPIYNGLENRLDRCLESIWNQDIDSSLYEVICIDDCSPSEATVIWLNEQTKLHSNLHLIRHSKNKRQGGARNTGIKHAQGKYIVLIDQDDYYDKDAFPKIANILSTNDLDLLIVDATYERPGEYNTNLQHNFPYKEIMTGDDQIVKNTLPFAPWKFIFKKQLLVENNLWFNENERIEDIDWVHRLTHCAHTALYQPILFIHYQKTDTSTTMTSFKSKETMYSTIRCGQRLLASVDNEFKESNKETQSKIKNLGNFVINLGLRNFIFCKDNFMNKSKMIKQTKDYCNSHPVSVISRMAFKFPKLFSIGSNISSYIAPYMLIVYRKVKYTIKGNQF